MKEVPKLRMATHLEGSNSTLSFSDFPEDVQFCILSFLDKSELATFACTSKRFVSLYRDDPRLWFSMCERRWGSKTLIKKWGKGKVSYKLLYKTLFDYENLIGFWLRSGTATSSAASPPPSPLLFFEWGPFYITGSRVTPSQTGTYELIKSPFLWMSLSSKGQPISYLDPEGKLELSENLVDSVDLGIVENENDLIPVDLSFMGKCHFVVKESVSFYGSSSSHGGFRKVSSSGNVRGEEYEDVLCGPRGILRDVNVYRKRRGGNGSPRRQRRRETEKQGRRKLEPEHFVKLPGLCRVYARW